MKSVLLIGLGRFGRHIAAELNELGHQVMAIDQSEEKVNAVLPYVTSALIGDSTNEDFMASIGVDNFDVCIVAIGSDFQGSLETTSLLDELGAVRVIARASRDSQAKIPSVKLCSRSCIPRKAAGKMGCHKIYSRPYSGLYRAGQGLFHF